MPLYLVTPSSASLHRRGPQPTAAIIDSQSVKAADTVGKASRGYDAGKKIEGRKRHLAVDTLDVRSAAGTLDQSERRIRAAAMCVLSARPVAHINL